MSEAPSKISIQPRMAETAARISHNSPKPSASVSSKSRSDATTAWSSTQAVGTNSRATPVKWRESWAKDSRRTPTAGSCTTAPPRPTLLSTTKWLMSQCSTQGARSMDNSSSSTRSGREASPSRSAMPTRSLRVAPLSERPKRRRRSAVSASWQIEHPGTSGRSRPCSCSGVGSPSIPNHFF